jgi:hypothetical protein
MRKILMPIFLALFLSVAIMSIGVVSSIPLTTQTNSTTTVFLSPPTINGTVIGQEFTVNLNIRGAQDVYSWQAGISFNPDVLNCTGFFEGEFLSNIDTTFPVEGTINNTAGLITPYGYTLLGDLKASGDGRLAYATFRVKSPGVSDLHLSDVILADWIEVQPGTWEPVNIPTNIIDVFTVVTDTTPQTVIAVSNSTGAEDSYHSGFSDHGFNSSLKEISFKVTGYPYPGFCNITIPQTLLLPEPPQVWGIIINGSSVSKTVTSNATHSSIYFTYSEGANEVKITTRFVPSTITAALSSTSITKGDSVTISGTIDPVRSGVGVTILFKPSDGTWATLGTVTTDSDSKYSYTWTPTEKGTYQIKAKWEGDESAIGDESEAYTLTVKGAEAGIPMEILAAAIAVIIVIAAVAIYFLKFRKPEEE